MGTQINAQTTCLQQHTGIKQNLIKNLIHFCMWMKDCQEKSLAKKNKRYGKNSKFKFCKNHLLEDFLSEIKYSTLSNHSFTKELNKFSCSICKIWAALSNTATVALGYASSSFQAS